MCAFRRAVCAVSGGVDSSVACYLMKARGFDVTGVFMRNWDSLDNAQKCSVDEHEEDACFVCRKFGVKFKSVQFIKEYWNKVFMPMVEEYESGFTPNPDIMCNRHIKFDSFVKYAVQNLGADVVATGHYARLKAAEGPIKGFRLLRGVDHIKDQTFFLSQVNQEALQHAAFPVGEFTKNEVKRIAQSLGLGRIVKKKESMGICFIGRNNFQEFIEGYVEPKKGKFIDGISGKVVGYHSGIHCWTVGQRCNIGGQKQAYFVLHKNPETQYITVVPGTNHPSLFVDSFITDEPHWIYDVPVKYGDTVKCLFKFQHKDEVIPCTVSMESINKLHVELSQPLRAVTPGQYAVFYDGDICLGSAKILEPGPSLYEKSCFTNVKISERS